MTMAAFVDQYIELAVAVDSQLDGRLPVGLAGHVEMHVGRGQAGGADFCLDLGTLVVEDIAEDHRGAFLGEAHRLARALAARPAADQRNLAIQLAHAPSLPFKPEGKA